VLAARPVGIPSLPASKSSVQTRRPNACAASSWVSSGPDACPSLAFTNVGQAAGGDAAEPCERLRQETQGLSEDDLGVLPTDVGDGDTAG
jgi:hypothetical protein